MINENTSPRQRSLSKHLTLTIGAIAIAAFSVAGGALFLGLKNELESVDRNELQGKELLIRHHINKFPTSGDFLELKHSIDDAIVAHGRLRVWLLTESGEVFLGGTEAPREIGRAGNFSTLQSEDGQRLEGIRSELGDSVRAPLASMIVGVSVGPRLLLLGKYRRMLLLVCGIGVLLITTLSAWTMARSLKPIRRLSEQASRISGASLSRRLDTADVDAEMTDLVRGFNGALDRVEIAYKQMDAFNADVAHELRTPLTSLINAAEIMLGEPRSSEALKETLAEQLEELVQLKGLVIDMLFLAQAAQGDQRFEATDVKLRNEVHKIIDYYDALLADARIAVTVDGDAVVPCNAGLIRRALSNLVSNAIKQTSEGETIRFRIRVEEGFAIVELYNPGAPIPEEIRARMFDRFFRADPARSRRGTSHGLGLAIVRAIVAMHQGQVFAASDPTGNTVGFKIPC